MTICKTICAWVAVVLLLPCRSWGSDAKSFPEYLQDSSVGEISAASILGIASSSVQTVRSAKDFNMVANAFGQGDNGKGVALLVSPVRVLQGYGVIPITREDYVAHATIYGLLENINVSYAQNKRTIGSTEFNQHAYSISTSTYLDDKQDPIVRYWDADQACQGDYESAKKNFNDAATVRLRAMRAANKAEGKNAELNKAFDDAQDAEKKSEVELVKIVNTCMPTKLREKLWNASNFAVSFGHGSIGTNATGNYSLGYVTAMSAEFGIGKRLALSVAGQHVQGAADISSIDGLSTRTSSTVGMVQLATNANDTEARTRYLAEWSTARSKSTLAAKSNFKYAAGLDYQLPKNLGSPWLQFRFGRSYANASGTLSNASLLSLSFGSTSTLFGPPAP